MRGTSRKDVNLRHGHARSSGHSREYMTWWNMLTRCFYKKGEKYPSYGGRGITVCRRWRKFENFLADMGTKPEGMTLERNNNDGNYGPRNCRWATPQEQALNRRTTDLFRNSHKGPHGGWKNKPSGLPRCVVKVKGKFIARIRVNGSVRHVGVFQTPEKAARAVRLAERNA